MPRKLWKGAIISAGILLSFLSTEARSAKGVELTFALRGIFEDISLTGAENTLFRSFSGTYSYEENTLDRDSTPNIGVYSLSNFDINIFDVNGKNTVRLNPSNWSGQLELASIDSEAGDPFYSLNFSRERTISDTFRFRVTWDWFLEADIVPNVPPTGFIRPQNSFLAEAIDPMGENAFYTVKAATVTPSTVPEPSFELGLLAFSTLSLGSVLNRLTLFNQNRAILRQKLKGIKCI